VYEDDSTETYSTGFTRQITFLATLMGNFVDAGKIIASKGSAMRIFYVRDMAAMHSQRED
jgi:hypothetical protein